MRNTSTKIALKQSDNFKFASLSKSITVGRNLNHLKCMQTLFTHIRTEDPWQGHTIRMFLQQLYRTVLKNALTRILYLSRSLSLVDVITFILDMATSGKRQKQRRVLFNFVSLSIHEYAHIGTCGTSTNQRTKRKGWGACVVPSPQPRTSRFSSAYHKRMQ